MEYCPAATSARRRRPGSCPASPQQLVRSRSQAEHINNPGGSSSQRLTVPKSRSKSTTRASSSSASSSNNNINSNTTLLNLNGRKSVEYGAVVPKRPKSASSPSAWALSPGRASHSSSSSSNSNSKPNHSFSIRPSNNIIKKTTTSTTAATNGGSEGGRSLLEKSGSVLMRYFKHQKKKVCPVQEDEYHRFKLLHNRLLQWRFLNAKARPALLSTKLAAQDKLFHVWVRIYVLRDVMAEKRLQVQKLRQRIRLYQIVGPTMSLLKEWPKLEPKSTEAVARLTRKLSALSHTLPLAEDVKADVASIHDAMSEAVAVMDSIEATIAKFFPQVEKMLYVVTELTSTLENQNERLEEMEKIIALIAQLAAWEKSARVHLLQALKESSPQTNKVLLVSDPNGARILFFPNIDKNIDEKIQTRDISFSTH